MDKLYLKEVQGKRNWTLLMDLTLAGRTYMLISAIKKLGDCFGRR
jgi:hypothetical protein